MLDFAIVGAGFGGIAMARALIRAGVDNFRVFEKAASVGGTWRENHYPGAACDVPSHLYSLADAPNSRWTRLFPRQPEIQSHLLSLGAQLISQGKIVFGWCLRRANWDAQQQCWFLSSTTDEQICARNLVLALGGLHVPAFPEIPGRERFSGIHFHSAQWRHDVDLRGRRMAVIGTGASAIQFVPLIAHDAEHVSVFQRSAPWLLPRPDISFPPIVLSALERWPWLGKLLRGSVFVLLEFLSLGLTHRRLGGWAQWLAKSHLRTQVRDPNLRERLTPNYPVGCKRILISSDYYPALTRPNVELVTETIVQIESKGLRLASGRLLEAEVLIYGSGFKPMDVLEHVEVMGANNRNLATDWHQRPQAHLGISVHGYPNLHFLLGPNTALGHNSVLYMIESQVRHIMDLQSAKRERNALQVEPTAAAQAAFLQNVDADFPNSAWAGGCRSWYLDANGNNIALWTKSCLAYRWLTRRVRAEDYCFS